MPLRIAEGRRPSAALVLGLSSGTLASVMVLPTAMLLAYRETTWSTAAEIQRLRTATAAISVLTEQPGFTWVGIASRLNISGTQLFDPSGRSLYRDGELPSGVDPVALCADPQQTARIDGPTEQQWTILCERTPRYLIIAARRLGSGEGARFAYIVLGLGLVVGISAALGVLQMVTPLNNLSGALSRVGAGERGVRVSDTGYAELDELGERLAAAARAMEDRHDAIEARVRVVQELARMVAHEIRNPLQSLELLTSLIAQEPAREERDGLARSIHDEIRSLDAVVTRLLRDSEGHNALRPDRTLTNLRDLAEHAVGFRKFEARRQGTKLEVGATVDRVLPVDKTLIGRALENLIVNAMQAVPQPGGHIVVSSFLTDQHLCVAVDDNGPGVDAALGSSIYESNVSGRETGTGLGLALVQGVMQAHGGYVDHGRSTMGGAQFRAWLPIAEQPES